MMRSSLTKAAESILGRESRFYPDWFRESEDTIEPLLQYRNHLYNKWLATGRSVDLSRFHLARGEASRTVCVAKNAWFQVKAREAEEGRLRKGGLGEKKCGSASEPCSLDTDPPLFVMKMEFTVHHRKPNTSDGRDTLLGF